MVKEFSRGRSPLDPHPSAFFHILWYFNTFHDRETVEALPLVNSIAILQDPHPFWLPTSQPHPFCPSIPWPHPFLPLQRCDPGYATVVTYSAFATDFIYSVVSYSIVNYSIATAEDNVMMSLIITVFNDPKVGRYNKEGVDILPIVHNSRGVDK